MLKMNKNTSVAVDENRVLHNSSFAMFSNNSSKLSLTELESLIGGTGDRKVPTLRQPEEPRQPCVNP